MRGIGTEPCSLCRGESPSIRCLVGASGLRYVDRRLTLQGRVSQLMRGSWTGCIQSACRLPTVDWIDRTERVESAECFENQRCQLLGWNCCNVGRTYMIRLRWRFVS